MASWGVDLARCSSYVRRMAFLRMAIARARVRLFGLVGPCISPSAASHLAWRKSEISGTDDQRPCMHRFTQASFGRDAVLYLYHRNPSALDTALCVGTKYHASLRHQPSWRPPSAGRRLQRDRPAAALIKCMGAGASSHDRNTKYTSVRVKKRTSSVRPGVSVDDHLYAKHSVAHRFWSPSYSEALRDSQVLRDKSTGDLVADESDQDDVDDDSRPVHRGSLESEPQHEETVMRRKSSPASFMQRRRSSAKPSSELSSGMAADSDAGGRRATTFGLPGNKPQQSVPRETHNVSWAPSVHLERAVATTT